MRMALLANISHYLLLHFLLSRSTLDCLFFKDGQRDLKNCGMICPSMIRNEGSSSNMAFHHNIFNVLHLPGYVFLINFYYDDQR